MLIERNNPVSMNARLGLRYRHHRARRWLAAGVAGLTLAGLGSYAFGTSSGGTPALLPVLQQSVGKAPTPPPFQADCSARPAALQQELSRIAGNFAGDVGIGITKAGCDWTVGVRLNQHFPQQSVSKLWVSMSVLDAIDQGRMTLDQIDLSLKKIDDFRAVLGAKINRLTYAADNAANISMNTSASR